MTRMAVIALVIATLLPHVRQARAAEGRWCAISSTGQGGIREDCQYATFEACQPAAADLTWLF